MVLFPEPLAPLRGSDWFIVGSKTFCKRLTTRAVTLPGGTLSEKLSKTVIPGRVGYAKVTFSSSTSPVVSDGCSPEVSKGSIEDVRSMSLNS